jgi:hypothetical protein
MAGEDGASSQNREGTLDMENAEIRVAPHLIRGLGSGRGGESLKQSLEMEHAQIRVGSAGMGRACGDSSRGSLVHFFAFGLYS